MKGARRATDFPVLPPPPSRHPAPCSALCRRLGSLVSTTTWPPSSSVEPTRSTSPTFLHVATTCCLSRQTARPPGECFPTANFLRELTINCHCPCTPGPAITWRRTTQPHSPSVSTPSPPATSCLSCHHRPHSRRLPRRRQPSSVSPELPNRSQPIP
jgi:hypothetical protein